MTTQSSRIAVFASFSGAGGVERMLINLLRAFADLERDVDLLTTRTDSPHLGALPARIQRIDLGTRHSLRAIPALASYLRAHRPAVLLAAKDRAGRAAVLARRLGGTSTPILLRLGTNLSGAMAHRNALQRWLRYAPIRRTYPQIEHIVAVSRGVAEDTARIARYPAERISVIPNPVITASLQEQARQACSHPWFAGAPRHGEALIVGAGRLEEQKDFPTLLAAFARLRADRPARLVILGEGAWRERLLQQARHLGIAADVDLPGFQTNPYAFLARADLFALSSRWEGSPNVLTEAMALGTPVVATDCPSGPREILDGGRYGPLVPVGDADALAAGLARALDAPTAPARLQEAVEDYRDQISARRYLALLDELALSATPPRGSGS
jgi:glycosyltransferase involved in cell wall biosynthesis